MKKVTKNYGKSGTILKKLIWIESRIIKEQNPKKKFKKRDRYRGAISMFKNPIFQFQNKKTK